MTPFVADAQLHMRHAQHDLRRNSIEKFKRNNAI